MVGFLGSGVLSCSGDGQQAEAFEALAGLTLVRPEVCFMKKSLLVVDDAEEMVELVTMVLSDWFVRGCASGSAALALLEKEKVDMVWLDSDLEDGPAQAILPQLRVLHTGKLIWFSGASLPPELEPLLDGHLAKPVQPAAIRSFALAQGS